MVDKQVQPHMDGFKEPALKNYYILTWPGGGTIGARALDQRRVNELLDVVRNEVLVWAGLSKSLARSTRVTG